MGWVKSTSAGAFAALLAACSSSPGSDLFGGPNGATDAGGGGTLDGGPGGSGNDAASDATTSSKDSGPGTPPQPPPPPPPPVDAAPPTDPGIHCGAKECTPGAQECCRTGDIGAETFRCVNAGKCGSGTNPMPIPCDDAFDCNAGGNSGDVCCATYEVDSATGQDHVIDVSCKAAANCDGTQMMITMCSPLDPGKCPVGTSCKPSTQTFVGYDLCL